VEAFQEIASWFPPIMNDVPRSWISVDADVFRAANMEVEAVRPLSQRLCPPPCDVVASSTGPLKVNVICAVFDTVVDAPIAGNWRWCWRPNVSGAAVV
jgi:hypothetical protein